MKTTRVQFLEVLTLVLLTLGLLLYREGAYLHDFFLLGGILAGVGSIIGTIRAKTRAGGSEKPTS